MRVRERQRLRKATLMRKTNEPAKNLGLSTGELSTLFDKLFTVEINSPTKGEVGLVGRDNSKTESLVAILEGRKHAEHLRT